MSLARSQVLKKQGLFHVPYRGTMLGAALGGGREMLKNPLAPGETMDERLEKKVSHSLSQTAWDATRADERNS